MADNKSEDAGEVVIKNLSDNEDDEILEITIPLVDDDLRAGQLGTQIYRNPAENQNSPRSLVTASSKKGSYYFQVRFHHAQYGTYKGQDACLIVLKLSFQQYSSSRFKSAELEVELEDAANLGLNPHAGDIDTTYRPRILDYEPKLFQGPVSEVRGSTKVKLDLPISAPGGIIGITPGISYTKESISESNFQIHGVIKETPPSKAHWVMREDNIRKNGIRSELSVVMVVNYTPKRRFAARVRFKADLFMTFLRPVCGIKDDPIFFDPELMKSGPTNMNTPTLIQQPTVPGIKAETLDQIDLKALTKLAEIGGQFIC